MLERYIIGAAGRVRPRPKSIRLAEDCLSALAPLNDLSVERLRRPVVEDLIATIAERAPRRAEMALSVLKRILRDAEERGQVVDPAVHRIRIAKAQEREARFLTWPEVEELRSWVPEYVAANHPDRGADDASPGRGARAARRRHRPRGRLDRRLRPAPRRAARRDQDARRPAAGRRRPPDRPPHPRAAARPPPERRGLPLPQRAGTPFDADNFMHRVFKPAAKAAGIPELTFHDLRHTGASLMIAAGCHVKVIAEQMGHSDGSGLVLRRYGHLYKGARLAAATELEAHVFGPAADRPVGWTWDDRQMGLDLDAR